MEDEDWTCIMTRHDDLFVVDASTIIPFYICLLRVFLNEYQLSLDIFAKVFSPWNLNCQ
jgi:hypothetical protein